MSVSNEDVNATRPRLGDSPLGEEERMLGLYTCGMDGTTVAGLGGEVLVALGLLVVVVAVASDK